VAIFVQISDYSNGITEILKIKAQKLEGLRKRCFAFRGLGWVELWRGLEISAPQLRLAHLGRQTWVVPEKLSSPERGGFLPIPSSCR